MEIVGLGSCFQRVGRESLWLSVYLWFSLFPCSLTAVFYGGEQTQAKYTFPCSSNFFWGQRNSVIPQYPVRIYSGPLEIWKSMSVSPFYKCNCLCTEPTHLLPYCWIASRGQSDYISVQYNYHGNYHYSVPIRELGWKSLYVFSTDTVSFQVFFKIYECRGNMI